jgi:hypothetical protein
MDENDVLKGVNRMKHVIYLSIFFLLLTLNASAEDLSLQASVPGEAGTVELTVSLGVENLAVMPNHSSVGPGPSTVPEPSTLALIGFGIVGLVGWRRFRKQG